MADIDEIVLQLLDLQCIYIIATENTYLEGDKSKNQGLN